MTASTVFGTITAGLVEYWDMDGDFAAQVDGTHVGTLTTTGTGSGNFVAGKFGQAIDLNSSSSNQAYVVVGGSESDFDFAASNMSLSVWYTTESLYTSWQALIAKGEGSAWRLARASGSGSSLNFAGPGGSFSGDGELDQQDGSWHHVVVTHEHNTVKRMYVDGSLVATSTNAGSIGNNGSSMQIGGNPNAAGRSWDGNIDDVAIWDRVITTDEIASIYNGGAGASIASLSNVAVPEPSSTLLLGLGGLALVTRRRRA